MPVEQQHWRSSADGEVRGGSSPPAPLRRRRLDARGADGLRGRAFVLAYLPLRRGCGSPSARRERRLHGRGLDDVGSACRFSRLRGKRQTTNDSNSNGSSTSSNISRWRKSMTFISKTSSNRRCMTSTLKKTCTLNTWRSSRNWTATWRNCPPYLLPSYLPAKRGMKRTPKRPTNALCTSATWTMLQLLRSFRSISSRAGASTASLS
mmetsp:Transcript_87261/g.191785  ORF Transcript_87261/g.191785 Transcript_87261/m.191785 type:complete len:207 (-) Transcript_87261:512-1132(-)